VKVRAFVDGLKLFRMGFSWGGTASLAMIYPDLHRPNRDYQGRLVRLNIGLEEPEDLIEDLSRALELIRA
jgi:cysteine-S-conjugate beta-lyase